MMEEIFTRKDKHGWIAYDRSGNSTTASTKQMAINQYRAIFGQEVTSVGYDMKNIDKVL